MDDPKEVRERHICVLAVLAMIGGVDNRPRLGGQVSHDDWGTGTICKIINNGKVVIQCTDSEEMKICKLTELTVVCSYLYYSNIIKVVIIINVIIVIILNCLYY